MVVIQNALNSSIYQTLNSIKPKPKRSKNTRFNNSYVFWSTLSYFATNFDQKLRFSAWVIQFCDTLLYIQIWMFFMEQYFEWGWGKESKKSKKTRCLFRNGKPCFWRSIEDLNPRQTYRWRRTLANHWKSKRRTNALSSSYHLWWRWL